MYKLLNNIDFKKFHNKLSDLYDKKAPLLLKKDVSSDPYMICKGTLLKIRTYDFSEDYSQLNLTVCILLDEVWFNISIKTEEFNEYFEVDTALEEMYKEQEKQFHIGSRRFLVGNISAIIILIIAIVISIKLGLPTFFTIILCGIALWHSIGGFYSDFEEFENSDSFFAKIALKKYHEIQESISKYIVDKQNTE